VTIVPAATNMAASTDFFMKFSYVLLLPDTGSNEQRTFTVQEFKVYPHMCFYFGRTSANADSDLAFRSHKNFFESLMGTTVPFFLTDFPSHVPCAAQIFA
jgi:hypothetical protein